MTLFVTLEVKVGDPPKLAARTGPGWNRGTGAYLQRAPWTADRARTGSPGITADRVDIKYGVLS